MRHCKIIHRSAYIWDRPALGPAHPLIHCVPWDLSPWKRRLRREADHSPQPTAEVKSAWSYTSTPPSVFIISYSVKHKENMMFTYNESLKMTRELTTSLFRLRFKLSHLTGAPEGKTKTRSLVIKNWLLSICTSKDHCGECIGKLHTRMQTYRRNVAFPRGGCCKLNVTLQGEPKPPPPPQFHELHAWIVWSAGRQQAGTASSSPFTWHSIHTQSMETLCLQQRNKCTFMQFLQHNNSSNSRRLWNLSRQYITITKISHHWTLTWASEVSLTTIFCRIHILILYSYLYVSFPHQGPSITVITYSVSSSLPVFQSRFCVHIRGKTQLDITRMCIQKFPDWPPGTRTANGTALCH
jgi:hypothetical protein